MISITTPAQMLEAIKDYAAGYIPDQESPAIKMQQTRYNTLQDLITYYETVLYADEERRYEDEYDGEDEEDPGHVPPDPACA